MPGEAARWSRRDFLWSCASATISAWAGSEPIAAREADQPRREATGSQGLVVSVSEPATRVGVEILRAGGNAVDAAVAVALALAVTYPPAGNIGGGGFMNVFVPAQLRPRFPKLTGPAIVFDYRETAPLKANKEMFRAGDSPHQHKTVGVPGTVAGLVLAHDYFGKLPWRQLVEPAIALAQQGFAVDAPLARSLNTLLSQSKAFAELQRVFAPPDGQRWKAGDLLRQPDLAWTLRQLAQGGAEAFYHGPIADKLIAEMGQGGGWITRDDLRAYRARMRSPIMFRFADAVVYSCPPASSGGITLNLILQQMEYFPYREWGRWHPRTLHLFIEAARRAYAERARWLGDPDFVKIPEHLLDPEHARRLASTIRLDRASPSAEIAPDIPVTPEGSQTTHFSVIDADGLAVANTYTLEHSYGSRIVVRGAGFLLNNEMTDFNWFPNRTTTSGLIGTAPNQIAPGKRMLSSMTPTIAVRNGRAILLTGSPGGRTIINTVAQVVLNRLAFGLAPRYCVDLPRLHHQWFPDQVRCEADPIFSDALLQELQQMGHQVLRGGRQGDAHSIFYEASQQVYWAVADKRISGAAAAR